MEVNTESADVIDHLCEVQPTAGAYVSLSVCLYVSISMSLHLHISKTKCPNFAQNFLYMHRTTA